MTWRDNAIGSLVTRHRIASIEWGQAYCDAYNITDANNVPAAILAHPTPAQQNRLTRAMDECLNIEETMRNATPPADSQDRWRLVRMSTDLLSQMGTRTEDGRRITAEWGEPDEVGIYSPTFHLETNND